MQEFNAVRFDEAVARLRPHVGKWGIVGLARGQQNDVTVINVIVVGPTDAARKHLPKTVHGFAVVVLVSEGISPR